RAGEHEAVEPRVMELRRRDRVKASCGGRGRLAARLGERETNLLLMVPALGQLTRDVEPVRRHRLPRPADAEARGRERIERREVARGLAGAPLHPGDQHGWAQAAI